MADGRLARTSAALLVAVEASILLGPPALRIPAGLMLGLALPGLAIARLLWWPRMSGAERLLLICGLSIVTAIIAGLVMNAAGIRLTVDSWAVALGLITAAGLACAAVTDGNRRRQADREPRSEEVSDGSRPTVEGLADRWRVLPNGGVRWYHGRRAVAAMADGSSTGLTAISRIPRLVISVVLAVTALAAIAASFVISTAGEHYRGPGFTELWAVPGRSGASPVRLGLISHEPHIARYTLRVSVSGRPIRAQAITLRPGQTWQSTQPVGSTREDLRFALQKWPSRTVYREVHVLAGGLSG